MRDVSKILSDAEVLKLRAILAQSPVAPIDEHEFQEYPKVLYHEDWLTCYLLIRQNQDPLIVKEAKEKIRHFQVIVHDFETEEDYLLDGWKNDPNDFIVAKNLAEGKAHPDPRVPLGRELRRTRQQEALTREQELRALKRRYAELTGQPLVASAEPEPDDLPAAADLPAAPIAAPAPVARRAAPAKPQSKAERVRSSAARATAARA